MRFVTSSRNFRRTAPMHAAVVVVATFGATAAWPCSWVGTEGSAPADGAADVALNSDLWFGIDDAPQNAALVNEATGERTELTVELKDLTRIDLPELAPSTSYRVELDVFDGEAPLRTNRFTTGALADDAAPAIAEAESAVTVEKLDGGLTFGEGCAWTPLPYWRDEKIVTSVRFDVEPRDAVILQLFATLDGERTERTTVFVDGREKVELFDSTASIGTGTYEIVALDAAGNETIEMREIELGELAGGCSQTSPSDAATFACVGAALALLRARRRVR